MRRLDEYDQDWLSRQTVPGMIVKVVAILAFGGLLIGGIGWLGGWFSKAAEVTSADNVAKQWQFAYDYNESLRAIANNWCVAKKVELAETDPEIRPQRTNQTIAQQQNYDRVKSEYDARLRDAFRGGIVGPPDVPKRAPTLAEKITELNLTGCPVE